MELKALGDLTVESLWPFPMSQDSSYNRNMGEWVGTKDTVSQFSFWYKQVQKAVWGPRTCRTQGASSAENLVQILALFYRPQSHVTRDHRSRSYSTNRDTPHTRDKPTNLPPQKSSAIYYAISDGNAYTVYALRRQSRQWTTENQKAANAVQRCSIENQKGVHAVQQCSIENQKGVNAVQRCSIENQKGAIVIDLV